jgi:cellulose synthase/poly-beta-1,6-N-acetylglucosamine synthase-like glycosyltransferase
MLAAFSDRNFFGVIKPRAIQTSRPVGNQPFWSVMIPTYNPQADYLEQTLRSFLAQDPGPEQMQIEVVDDCSPGVDVAAMVKSIAVPLVETFSSSDTLAILCSPKLRRVFRLKRPCKIRPEASRAASRPFFWKAILTKQQLGDLLRHLASACLLRCH